MHDAMDQSPKSLPKRPEISRNGDLGLATKTLWRRILKNMLNIYFDALCDTRKELIPKQTSCKIGSRDS